MNERQKELYEFLIDEFITGKKVELKRKDKFTT